MTCVRWLALTWCLTACVPVPTSPLTAALSKPVAGRAVADLHTHPTLASAMPLFHGRFGDDLASSADHNLINQADETSFLAANVRLIFGAVWVPPFRRPGRTCMGDVDVQLRALERWSDAHPTFALVRSVTEARHAMALGRIAVVPTIEGLSCVHEVNDIDRLFNAGLRSMQLVHLSDNSVADAIDDQLGSAMGVLFNGETAGLSPLGRAAVTRMLELGIIIDLAHASDQTMREVLALAEAHHTPLIVSHAGSDVSRPRTVSDESARRVGALNGLIGIGVFRSSLLAPIPREERWPGFVETSCDEVLAHWLHFASLAGPNNVVLGSDLGSMISRPRAGGACPHGVRNAGDLPELLSALINRGIEQHHLDSSAERVLALWNSIESQRSRSP